MADHQVFLCTCNVFKRTMFVDKCTVLNRYVLIFFFLTGPDIKDVHRMTFLLALTAGVLSCLLLKERLLLLNI